MEFIKYYSSHQSRRTADRARSGASPFLSPALRGPGPEGTPDRFGGRCGRSLLGEDHEPRTLSRAGHRHHRPYRRQAAGPAARGRAQSQFPGRRSGIWRPLRYLPRGHRGGLDVRARGRRHPLRPRDQAGRGDRRLQRRCGRHGRDAGPTPPAPQRRNRLDHAAHRTRAVRRPRRWLAGLWARQRPQPDSERGPRPGAVPAARRRDRVHSTIRRRHTRACCFRTPQEEAMPELSSADHGASPPSISIPREYNAAHDLIEQNLRSGRAEKTAFIDDFVICTYGELDRRTSAFANVLRAQGLGMESRILLCLHDTIDFPVSFLGAIKAGVVPVAVNTLLTQADYEYMLCDSRARVAVVSAALLPLFQPLLGKVPGLERILVSDGDF